MPKLIDLMFIVAFFFACNTPQKAVSSKVEKGSNASASINIVSTGPDTITTLSGLKYLVFRHKGGSEKPNYADKVSVNYRGKLSNGTIFDDSYKRGEPFEFQLGMRKVIRGWDEGIALLSVGDSALLIIPPSLGYGDIARGGIPANSTLYFEVELVKVKEPVFVNEYIWQNKPPHITSSGLKYYVVKEGSGNKAYKGGIVKIHYTGYLADGKMFETTILNETPVEYQVGTGLPGLDEGLLLMHQGSKYRFIVPPILGYGNVEAGGGLIPANSILTFDCELVEVK